MKTGVLMLHGFSGGPYEVEPFANFLKQQTDWIIHTPTFSGHGDVDQLNMKGFTAHNWLMDAELAYRKLAKQVDEIVVAGFSMGGIIAIHLAQRYHIKKLVLLSAAAKYISPAQLIKDMSLMAVDAYHRALKDNELFLRYQHKFRNVPLSATIQFMEIVRRTEPYIAHIKCPTYIVQGAIDGIVPSITASYIYDKILSTEKKIYMSENGKHHICYSDDRERWFSEVLKFLQDR